jgi:hypothetical protein
MCAYMSPEQVRGENTEPTSDVQGTVMVQPMTLEDVARRAIDGNRDALDSLVRDLQGDIYGLALRMLWNREDSRNSISAAD